MKKRKEQERNVMKRGFEPIIDDNSKILILGSLPGDKSIADCRYYAHPRNVFWKILYEVFGEDMPASFDERYDFILRRNLALWDVLARAERKGSGDCGITNEKANAVPALLSKYGNIRRILFNGKKAAESYKKHFKYFLRPSLELLIMPSTSPAYAAVKYDDKLNAWRAALTY